MIPDNTADKPAAKPGEGETMDLAAFAAAIAEMLGLPPETPQTNCLPS